MSISRPLAWCVLLLALLGSSLLRQLNDFVPDWTPLPWPVRSPIYALLVVLFLVLLAAPAGLPSATASGPASRRVPLGLLMPFLIALIYEKILSVTLYDALLDHAVRIDIIRNQLDAWIHVIIGLGMSVAVVLLIPVMRSARFGDFLLPRHIRSGVALQAFALAVAYAVLIGMAAILGASSAGIHLVVPFGPAALMLFFGQGVRAMSEEFYYRGLLQRELLSTMPFLGVRNLRNGQALAVALIAMGFGIEHFRFGVPITEAYRGFAYAVAVGFLFGYLLVYTGNVFFCGLVHATNNFFTEGLMPRFTNADGSVGVGSEPVLFLYLIAVFLAVYLAGSMSRAGFRRRLLAPPGPSPPPEAA